MANKDANFYKATGAYRAAIKLGGRWHYVSNILTYALPEKLVRWCGSPSASIKKVMAARSPEAPR